MFQINDIVKLKSKFDHIFKSRNDKFIIAKIKEITPCCGLSNCQNNGSECIGGMVLDSGTTQKCWFYNKECILEKI